jgi:hypothetical protein
MIITRINASQKIALLDPWLPFVTIKYDRMPMIAARTTGISAQTRIT